MSKLSKHSDLKEIFDQSYNNLVLQTLRYVKIAEIGEDIVQDCFIKLWEKKDELNISGNINAYLSRMVRNRCLDYIKKKRLQTSELNETYQAGFIAENTLETEDLQSEIDEILDGLPEKCRQVFILSRFEEMSYKEIATELDISKKTVEAHVSKALKAFRANLKQYLIIILKRLRVVE